MTISLPRSAGILLHPTSLPGPYGIGDLGPAAYRWIDTLVSLEQSWWQILPLGPTGYGDSPYQAYSAFAGNIFLISPEKLKEINLLPQDWDWNEPLPTDHVDFTAVAHLKNVVLDHVFQAFQQGHGLPELKQEFQQYRDREAHWLSDYSAFMVFRDAFGQIPLTEWPAEIRKREPSALAAARQKHAQAILRCEFGQFLFDRQWTELRQYANAKGIQILGDAPIFVAGDSSDVWANPKQFLLDANLTPTVVAGVPPDYFSKDGQLWGNPLYDWDRMAKDGYDWWVRRIRRQLDQVDYVRLDHFRGFAAAWHVPATDTTAKGGKWVDGPRAKLFEKLQQELGNLPIVAEDLGLITKDVDALRLQFELPGMRVLQFALGGPDNPYWPHNYEPNTVAYTGTHDNDTTLGWFSTLDDEQKHQLAEYTGYPFHQPNWDLIRMAWSSVAKIAIAPLQDILNLGGEARMNTPGLPQGNWTWRCQAEQFQPESLERIKQWTVQYYRDRLKEKE